MRIASIPRTILGLLLTALAFSSPQEGFQPDRIVNRSELVQVLIGIEFDDTRLRAVSGNTLPLFRDVNPNSKLGRHLELAYQEGIIRKMPERNYGPRLPVTFLQAAKVLGRTVGRHHLKRGVGLNGALGWLDQRQAIPPTIQDLKQPLSRGDLAEILFRLKLRPRNLPSMRFDPNTRKLWTAPPVTSAYLPLLMFHHILELSPEDPGYGLSLAPKKFEGFLQYLQREKIATLTFRDLQAIREGRLALPKRAILLSFDDGYLNNYQIAFPLLEKYHARGNFAIITTKVGDDGRHMNWKQIRTLSEAGHEICSHTRTHRSLATLSEEQIRRELMDSRKTLEKKIGAEVSTLVYPAGSYDKRVIRIALEAGYHLGRTTHGGKIPNFKAPMELPIVRVHPETSVASLKRWMQPEKFKRPNIPPSSMAALPPPRAPSSSLEAVE
jgi:peptidoglycan/xylan/chitin deacetylase (PgdA/CDA1 family)